MKQIRQLNRIQQTVWQERREFLIKDREKETDKKVNRAKLAREIGYIDSSAKNMLLRKSKKVPDWPLLVKFAEEFGIHPAALLYLCRITKEDFYALSNFFQLFQINPRPKDVEGLLHVINRLASSVTIEEHQP